LKNLQYNNLIGKRLKSRRLLSGQVLEIIGFGCEQNPLTINETHITGRGYISLHRVGTSFLGFDCATSQSSFCLSPKWLSPAHQESYGHTHSLDIFNFNVFA